MLEDETVKLFGKKKQKSKATTDNFKVSAIFENGGQLKYNKDQAKKKKK